MELIVAGYAAVVSTAVAILQWLQWRSTRVGVQLRVSPRIHQIKPDRYSHIEVDIQVMANPTNVRAVYLAAYKSWWRWALRQEASEVLGSEWSKIFPVAIEPGHGWEGLLAINDSERALAARYSHVRLAVRHTGSGRVVSRPVSKLLQR